MTALTHVSPVADALLIYAVDQEPVPGYKPRGFWYEVDGDWRRWCSGEMPDWVEGRFLHSLTLGEENILRLSTVAALDQFARDYGVTELVPGYSEKYGPMHRGIRWADVAESWDGIEIAPYHWSRRLDGPSWYYGWDCASGCIWRPRGATLAVLSALRAEEAEAVAPGRTDPFYPTGESW